MEPEGMPPTERRDADDPVPIFGTWRRIYAAVVVWAVLVMGLIALFSSWPF
jgi:hypothetical protein